LENVAIKHTKVTTPTLTHNMSCWESLLYLPTFPYPCQPVLHNCCPHHSQQHQQRFLSSPRGWFFLSCFTLSLASAGSLPHPSSSGNGGHPIFLPPVGTVCSGGRPSYWRQCRQRLRPSTAPTSFAPNLGLLSCLLAYASWALVSEFIFHPRNTQEYFL